MDFLSISFFHFASCVLTVKFMFKTKQNKPNYRPLLTPLIIFHDFLEAQLCHTETQLMVNRNSRTHVAKRGLKSDTLVADLRGK